MKRKKKKNTATPVQKAGPVLRIVSAAVAAAGVFWIPWYFSSTMPTASESYTFGFNNRVAMLALAFSILLAIAGCYFGGRGTTAFNWIQPAARIFPAWSEAPVEYCILICICTLICSFLIFWTGYLADPAWCESRFFIYGMDLIALGLVPYRDFQFNYGPATLYLPFWLSHFSGGLISTEQAYAIILVLFTIAGFVCIFVIIRCLELPKSTRAVVLALGVVCWTTETLGLQYAPFRFVVVPVALIVLHRFAQKGSGAGALLWPGMGAAIATTMCLSLSPEMAITGCAGVCAYGFILLLRRTIPAALACWLGAGIPFALIMMAFPGYLYSVFAFGSGTDNFPIYPDMHNLCLIGASLITLPPLIAAALANPREEKAPFALAFAVAVGMLLPAAFGRCDPGHVTSNTFNVALLMFAATAAAGKIAFRIWTGVYAVLFVILSQISYWNQYVPNFRYGIAMHDFYEQHPDMVAGWKAKWDALRLSMPHGSNLHWSKVLMYPQELEALTSKGGVLLTSGNEGNLWLARFLLLQNPPSREYFDAYTQGAATPAQIDQKVREDRAYEFLIVPQGVMDGMGNIDLDAYKRGEDSFLSKLFLFPVDCTIKNRPYLPDSVYARRVLDYYKPIARFSSYIILERKAAS
ncbi:MAG: hypothetical protein ABSE62_14640 [Chthoniobacteraceae bacterium]|jgi:hypothetical protein